MKVTGIILAGGQSSRMGTDKAFIKLGNKTLIQHSIDKLKEFCNEIIISSNKNFKTEYPIVHDEIKNIGPVGGIISCLSYSSNDINIVLSCDMPFITEMVFRRLIQNQGEMVTVPTIDGKNPESLCAIYKKPVLTLLKKEVLKQNYKLQKIIGGIPHRVIDLSDINHQFLNINHPHDLKKANMIYNKTNS